MTTFRQYLEMNDQDDLRARYNARTYMNTAKPVDDFNSGKSLMQNIGSAAVDGAVDMAADALGPVGTLGKVVGKAAMGYMQDRQAGADQNVAKAKEALAQKYRMRPESMLVSDQLKGLMSPMAWKTVDGMIGNEAVLRQVMQQNRGQIPPDYATQVAVNWLIQQLKAIRGK